MKAKTYNISLLLVLPLFFATPIAYADWGITLEADNQHDRYKDQKDDARALLGIQYRGKKFNIDSKAISYDFTDSEQYAIEAILKSNNHGYEAKDSKAFTGLSKRDASIDVGVRGILNTQYGPVVLEMTRDVDASKGYEADLRLGGIVPHNEHWTGKRELTIAPLMGVKYQSEKVVDYYYGVKNSEATSARASYSGKASTTPYVGIESQINISKRVSMNAGLIYERKDNTIRNSPLTDKKSSDVLLNLGVTYWF